jgi:uncharacterized membrane protein YgcG
MIRALLFLSLLIVSAASADERILEFHSDIVVTPEGWIDVTERITVRAEGNQIRRGIYRDFPTDYQDQYGNNVEVDFEPQSVLRDGEREDFHSDDFYNGVRVYFGSANRYLDPGEYTYTFRYRANRMLGFFEQHDELYWNVTGLDWAFPIDKASATVSFAFDVQRDEVFVEAYTGSAGSTDRNYSASIDVTPSVTFAVTRKLPPHHGLTIVVGWPKGRVTEPSDLQRLGWLLKDNSNLLIAMTGLLLLLVFYIPVWRSFGKDPEPGVLVTRYEPPAGYSPASLRYIRQMYYDDKTMTAAVVNLAVKGYLRINALVKPSGFFNFGSKENEHSLSKTDPGENPPPLAAGEAELLAALFAEGDKVVLENDNHELLGKAKSQHQKSLKEDYRNKYFKKNGLLNVPAILIVITATVLSLSSGSPNMLVIATVVAMFLTVIFFANIMKRPTMRGRKLLDDMEGFRDYLEVAEKDEMALRNPPEKTPELFEAYLPYALALGVDQQWAEKFAAVLSTAQRAEGGPYSPSWYNGSWNVANLTDSTSQLSSSLNTAISSSVTPPGSSSGSGGGSSGGGGGGGGGGGW